MAGPLFGIYPINVTSVAWIAQRKIVLSMLVALTSTEMCTSAIGRTSAQALDMPHFRAAPGSFVRVTCQEVDDLRVIVARWQIVVPVTAEFLELLAVGRC